MASTVFLIIWLGGSPAIAIEKHSWEDCLDAIDLHEANGLDVSCHSDHMVPLIAFLPVAQ